MKGIILVVLLFAGSSQGLPQLGLLGSVTVPTPPTAPLGAVNTPSTPLTAPIQQSESDLLNQAFQAALVGVNVTNPLGPGSLVLGLMVLPANALCVDTNLTNTAACHICWQDCLYVHNRYGGQCAYSEAAGEQRCTCYDDAFPTDANGSPITAAADTCASITGNKTVDAIVDSAIKSALVGRYTYFQCSAFINSLGGTNINEGCNVDCTDNHQYISPQLGGYGLCAYQTAVAPDSDGATMPFCTCGYNATSATNSYSS